MTAVGYAHLHFQSCVLPLAALHTSCKHQTQCTDYICISCSGAACQSILTSGLQRSTRVTIWCCFPVFLFVSLCLPLSKCMEKSSLLLSGNSTSSQGWDRQRGCEKGAEQICYTGTLQTDLALFLFLCFFYSFLLCLRVLKQNVDTFPPRCIQDASEVLDWTFCPYDARNKHGYKKARVKWLFPHVHYLQSHCRQVSMWEFTIWCM